MSGYCVAGIDANTGEWIRPVSSHEYGEFWLPEVIVLDRDTRQRRLIQPLDEFRLKLHRHVGDGGQPENWLVEGDALAFDLFSTVRSDPPTFSQVRRLAEASNACGMLFGTPGKSLSYQAIIHQALASSLCVVHPRNLAWVRTTKFHSNEPKIEGQFNCGSRNLPYCLSLTDIYWEETLLKLTSQNNAISASETPGMNGIRDVFLTISLGHLFAKTQCHYKLIAGVLLCPQQRPAKKFLWFH